MAIPSHSPYLNPLPPKKGKRGGVKFPPPHPRKERKRENNEVCYSQHIPPSAKGVSNKMNGKSKITSYYNQNFYVAIDS